VALPYLKLSSRLDRARRDSRDLFAESHGGGHASDDPDGRGAESPGGASLSITCRRSGASALLALRGELDLASRHELEREIVRAESIGFESMIVDLSALEFMDCSGMHALLAAHRRAHAAGRQMSLRRGPREVHRLFELAGVDQVFQFEAEPEAVG
jgi:anti-sigma B factor antagonist